MQAAFITVHGIDGTGKTSTTQEIVKALKQRGQQALDFNELPSSTFAGDNTRSMTSLEKKRLQSTQITGLLLEGITVVKDRWVIDVVADSAWQGKHLTESTADSLMPNLSVLLTCAEHERMRRINMRGEPTDDDLVPCEPGTRAFAFQGFLAANLQDYSQNQLHIDTTYQDACQVSELVVDRAVSL